MMPVTITCPTCGHVGTPNDFWMSLADECFCPNGCPWFLFGYADDEEEEE